HRLGHRISAVIGGGVVLVMIGLTASCSTESSTPEESTTTTTTTPAVTPTEKKISPDATDGLTPPVKAPQPTVKHPDGDSN
ncbi:MAG: hypothetical protein K0R68_3083, partial [Mycobacterium sp.]|nr:hypothetical protein [Mycobacterium sp.]